MTLPPGEAEAQEALRARQGKGARYDDAAAPAEDLLVARRGTAYFARKLMELPDAGLYAPAARPAGWLRAHVVAEVSYAARRQALALEALAAGAGGPGDEAPEFPDLDLAATLPARALRHLFEHSAIHLNVCWRDLSAADWDRPVTLPDGSRLQALALPQLRAAQIWQGALDLGNGGALRDVPQAIRDLMSA